VLENSSGTPPAIAWSHRRRLRPLASDCLLLGQEGDRWLGLVLVWLDEREVTALCTSDNLGDTDFMPLVAGGAQRGNEVQWWRPWCA
jgi:hypothetical protein